ncbi:MAG: hypothetical protein JW795_13055, partial [Chitinivibrionales bacterium]|nr:hypothetical protein [Chitinivibrionales bacterium]
RPVLLLLSDFQSHDIEQTNTAVSRYRGDAAFLFITFIEPKPWNYTLRNAQASLASPALECSLDVQNSPLRNATIETVINNMRFGSQPLSADIGSRRVSIDLPTGTPTLSGKLTLTAADPFPLDNSVFVCTAKLPQPIVMIVSDDTDPMTLSAALQTLSNRKTGGKERFGIRLRTVADLSFDDIDSASVIILNSIHQRTDALEKLITAASFSNKAILFSPALTPQAQDFNQLVFNHLWTRSNSIKKVTLTEPAFAILPDTVSALWRAFPRFDDRDVAVYEYLSSPVTTSVVRLSTAAPLVTITRDNRSISWVVFTTPISITTANNLCETGFFVPLLDRLIEYSLEQLNRPQGSWIAATPYRNPFFQTQPAELFDSEHKYRATWHHQSMVSIDQPGIYTIVPKQKAAYTIAVNCDPQEGSISAAYPQITDLNKQRMRLISDQQTRDFFQRYNTPSLFDLLWVAFVIVLCIEMLLWKDASQKNLSGIARRITKRDSF